MPQVLHLCQRLRSLQYANPHIQRVLSRSKPCARTADSKRRKCHLFWTLKAYTLAASPLEQKRSLVLHDGLRWLMRRPAGRATSSVLVRDKRD